MGWLKQDVRTVCRSSPISHTHRLYPHNVCSIKLAHTNFVVLLLPYPGRQFPYLRQHTCVLCMTSLAISNLGTGQISYIQAATQADCTCASHRNGCVMQLPGLKSNRIKLSVQAYCLDWRVEHGQLASSGSCVRRTTPSVPACRAFSMTLASSADLAMGSSFASWFCKGSPHPPASD